MLMRVTAVDYLPKSPEDSYTPRDLLTRVVGRSEDGERVVRLLEGTLPHCYVPADEPMPALETDEWNVINVETGYKGIDIETGSKVDARKVTLGHPKQTSAFVDEFSQSFESDIPFYRRVTWDHGLSGYIDVPEGVKRCHVRDIESDIDTSAIDPIEPRVAIGDIEVADDQDRGFEAMKQAADAPVVAATWYDTYDEEYTVIVMDPGTKVDPVEVKENLAGHWDDHELADEYVDEADIRLVQVSNEYALLAKCIDYIADRRPDITAGWNWVDFDWYYLLERISSYDELDLSRLSDIGYVEMRKVNADRRGTESAVQGLPAFDQMSGYQKQTYGELRSSKLEYVASDQLGIGKISGMTVNTAFENRRSEMTAYNLLDVQLTVALTEMHGIEDFFLDLADLCGIQIQDTYSEKREVQGYIGARRSDDQVMPTNTVDEIETPAGGLVLTPGDGIYENVAVFDLKSLYPSSMLSMNISPETHTQDLDAADVVIPGMPEKEADVGGNITEDDINWENDDPELSWSQRPKGFQFDEQGIIPEFAGEMFPERESRKDARDEHDPGDQMYVVYDNQQRGVKVVHNSMFGVLNSKYFALAKDGIGDAITGISRYILWRAAEFFEEMGYEVIYGDTDSVLVSLSEDGSKFRDEHVLNAKGLQTQLNTHMAEVADDLGLPDDHPFVDMADLPHGLPDDANHAWFFEFEKLYGDFVQVGSKKRYAGTLVHKEGKDLDGELDVTGFEAERTDQMEVTAEVQRQVIRALLDDWGFSDVSEMVREEFDRFAEGSDDLHEIGVPWGLNKPISEYGNRPNVRAASFSNEHLGKDYGAGDDYRGYYVKRTPSFVPETDVIALDWTDDIPPGYELAREKTIEKAFESALAPLLEEVGWTFNEVREGRQNQSAMAFDQATDSEVPWDTPGPEDAEEPREDDAETPDGSEDNGGALQW